MPECLSPGDTYRVLFLTNARQNAIATDAATYDNFARGQASTNTNMGDFDAVTFQALISTAGESMRARTNTDPDNDGTGEPIFFYRGDKVADNYADFYDLSWDTNGQWNQRGVSLGILSGDSSTQVWTGSTADGAISTGQTPGSTMVAYGEPSIDGEQFFSGTGASTGVPVPRRRLYALSNILMIPSDDPPILQSATVDGATLLLTYSEALDNTSPPSAGAYTVMVSPGAAPTVSTVAINDDIVTLTLSTAVSSDQTVTLDYAVPGSDPIQDADGNEAAALDGQAVENNTPPILESATVNGATLVLTYNDALDNTSTPSTGAYTVMVSPGAAPTVSTVTINNRIVTLTLSTAVSSDQTVTLDYAVPGSDPIQDADGNEAAALNGQAVGNSTPPILQTATVNGATLVLTYNDTLDGTSTPFTGAYTVMVSPGGDPTVSTVAISNNMVTLTLSAAVSSERRVTLDYAVPGSDPIQDVDGNEAAALNGRAVVNMTLSLLEDLDISDGVLVFNSATFEYDIEVATTVESVTVTPDARSADATITVNGDEVASDADSRAIPLTAGMEETITIVVAATDGTTQTYVLTVTRPLDTSLRTLAIRNTDILRPPPSDPDPGLLTLIQLPPGDVPSGTPTEICENPRVQSATRGFDPNFETYIVCAESSPGDANERNIMVSASVTERTETDVPLMPGMPGMPGVPCVPDSMPPSCVPLVNAQVFVSGVSLTGRIRDPIFPPDSDTLPISVANSQTSITVQVGPGAAVRTIYTVQIFPLPPRPILERAIVRDNRLFLVYSRQLDTASIPSPDDFTVLVEGVRNDVTAVEIRIATLDPDRELIADRAQVVALDLASRVNFGQRVTLTYTPLVTNPLQDGVNGNVVARLSLMSPTPPSQVAFVNLTPDIPARPEIRSSVLNNINQLELALGSSSLFFALFQPTVGGANVNIAGFTVVNDLTGMPVAVANIRGGINPAIVRGDPLQFDPLLPFMAPVPGGDTIALSFNEVLLSPSYTVTYTPPPFSTDPDDPDYPRRLRAVDEDGNPAPNTEVSAFTISTDITPPTVESVAITSTTGPYAQGEDIEVTVTFDEVVGVNEDINDMPQIPLQLDAGTTVQALYGVGTADTANRDEFTFSETLVFTYRVVAGDTDTDGVSIAADALADALDAASGIIQDPAGNNARSRRSSPPDPLDEVVTAAPAHIVDTTAPTVDDVAITSTTDPYVQDEEIEVTVTFSEPVTVSGTPAITLLVGATSRPTTAVSVSSSNTVVLTYTVVAGDNDADGVSIAADALSLPTSDLIQDPAGNNAVLTHGEVPAATAPTAHIVDTTPPALIAMPAGATVNGDTLTLTYDEPLDDSSMPSPTTYTVTVSPGTAPIVEMVAINNQIVTLTLDEAVSSDQTVTLTYAVPSSNPIQDVAGNDAAALNIQVTNNTPPPQISIAADTSGPVSEGTTVTFTVTATAMAPPASDLPVTVNVGQTGDFLSDAPAPGEQTVTILANQFTVSLTVVTVDDDVDEEDGSVTATVTAGAGYTIAAPPDNTASVTVTDDDDAGVTVSQPMVTVLEDGSTATYTVVLDTEPTADVTITPTSDDTSVATVSAALTFTPTNWNTAQTVTVTGVNDDVDNTGNQRTTTVNHAAASTDTNYEAGSMVGSNIASVTVTATDDDTAGVTVTQSDGDTTVAEPSGTDTYTVVLTTQPTGDVTITPASDDTLVALVSGALTFTTTDWNMEQTVTVTVVDDNIDNAIDRTTTVTHAIAGGGYDSVGVADVEVTATDDDDPPTGITLSLNPSSVGEDAGNAAITVTATLEGGTTRDADTVVMLSTADGTATEGTDYTAATAPLTIQRGTASADMTLTIPIMADGIDEEDNETLLVGGTTTVLLLPIAGATLTINDIDPLPTLAIDSLPVNEGNSGPVPLSYTVTLTGQTARTVMVDYADADTGTATSDGTDYDTIASGTLTFTPGTTIQNIGVTVRGDTIDEGDETFVVRLSNPTNAMITTADGTGTITDDDTVGVTVSQSMVTVTEEDGSGRTATYTLVLNTQPTAEVTITPASDDTSVAMVSDALTFTTMNWNTPQTVTVTGVDDDIDSDRTTSVTHPAASSDSGYDMVTIASVTVTVTNDDDAGVTVTESGVDIDTTVGENDGEDTYTVVLTTQPTGDVTITPASDDTSVALVSGALTFTTTNWNTPQTVTVTGVNDDIDNMGDQRTTTVTHVAASTDGNYEGFDVDSVAVTATDDDGPPSLAIDSPPVTEGDDGATVTLTYTVTLTGGTERQVTVEYADADGGTATSGTDYDTITGGTLTFTPGTTTQNIDVTVTGDNIDEENETVVVRLSMPDNAMITTADGTGTITDDDTAGVTVSGTMVTVDEAGGMADYTVVLDTQPTDEVTITPASDDTSVAMVSGALTFTTMNWNTAQTVTVTGVDDVIDSDRTTTVTHLAASTDSGYNSFDVDDVMVTATDNDTAGLTFDPASVNVPEGSSSSYTVVLDTEPTDTVTVAITAGGDVSTNPTSLTFTTTDWDTAQTVTVNAAEDADGNNDSQTLAHAASGGEYDSVTGDVVVTVMDNDAPGVTVSESALTVDPEAGGTADYTVVLNTQPTAEVTITPESDDTSVALVSGVLTFTTMNWNTAQTVTVTGVNDNIDNVSDRTATVTHTIAGGGYDSVGVADVAVTATDDDTAGLTFDSAAVNVTEGGSSSYTVVLDTEPTVTVTVAITAGGDVSTNLTSLTFTTTDWNIAQTVTVNAAQDADGNNDSETLAHAASGGEYGSVTGTVMVTVIDDDAPNVTVTPVTVDVDEGGGTVDYTVVLNTQPTAEVTITPESDDPSVALVSGALTFTTTDWSTAQTVTVTGVNDNIDNPSDQRTTTVTHLAASMDSDYNSFDVDDVMVTATDNDTAGLTFDPAAVNVTEGDSSSYTVVLNTEPTVTVTVAIPAVGDVTADPASLTFTTTDWNTAQTVTVTAAQDADGNNDSETLAHTASGAEYGSVTGTVMVTVIDSDTPGVTVSESALTVDPEAGGTADYTVVLVTQPTADVTITPASDDTSVALVSGVLTFTTTDWSTAQTVTVTGVNDNIDNVIDRTATVTHAIAGGGYDSVGVADVAVTATDDDTAGLTFDPAAVNVTEGDSSSYTVELATEPTDTVTVAIPAVGDVTADPASLTFTTSNWNTAQTVTVTAAEDADGNNDIEMLAHTASGAEYDSVTGAVMVTVTDNDAPGVTVSESALTVDPEAGGTADYTVVLNTQPTAEVTITPASDDTSVALVSGALTFTTTDWSTAQTVTVTGVNDNIDNPSDQRTTTVTHLAASTDSDYNSFDVDDVMVTATDDDTVGLTFDPAAVNVDEGDSSSYTVVLDTEPTTTVTVAITAVGDVTADPASLTFTTSNWNIAQTVTVTAAEDADGNNDIEMLAHTASGGEYDSVTGDVVVTVMDNDAPGVTVSESALTVDPEAGGTADYTVVLVTQPMADVTITPASDDTSVALVSGALTFTTTDWDTAQTVTVTGVNDNIDNVSDRTATVTHAATSSDVDYEGVPVAPVMVTATDNDTAGLTFDPASVSVNEGGSSSYTVVLNTEPTVTVTVAITAGGDVSTNLTSLTFTTSDWNAAQTVTVTAAEDADGNNDSETLAHAASGGEYDTVTGTVMVTVIDDDAPNVTVTPVTVDVDEAGGTVDYTVVLNTQPTAEVTITPASDDTSVALVSGALTFTTTDWSTAQTVTVTGVNDNIDNPSDQRTTTVTHLAASTDSDYNSFDVDDVMVTATDDDTAGLTFDPAAVNVDEGDSSSYTVVLDTEPTTTVTVAITAGGDVTADPASLTFTTSNWNIAQTVTVTAAEDADGNNDIEMLAHTASGGEYDSVTDTVMVTVMDNDAPGVTVSESALTVDPEAGGTADYTVVLVTQPMADVTITPASDDTSVALVSGALTFTPTDWDTAQTVTVTGVDDDIDNTGDERITTVTHAATSSDVDYEGVPVAPVMVTANDDDTAGLTFDPASVNVLEGDSSSYTVELATEPTTTVTVAITAGGDVSTNPASLTFTTSDWNTAQTVTVNAAEDADGNNDSETLAHAASGGEYGSVTGDVVVTVMDNDAPGVTVSESALTVDPEAGGTADYTVVLVTQPMADVTITPASDDTSVALVSGALTFTTTDWDTAQTVTVTGVDDDIDNTGDERITTVTHAATSSDVDYEGVPVAPVMVTANDDDTAGLTFDPASVSVNEGGSSSYTVVLNTEPTVTVTVAITAGGDVSTNPTSLTFTTTDWNAAQTVTVTAAEDADGNNDSVTLAHAASGGGYGSVTGDVEVTVIDDEVPGVRISTTTLTVPEGGPNTYTVRLNTQPGGDVVVTVNGASGDVSFSGSPLTFTTSNWETDQTVTVNAAQDDDAAPDAMVTLTHAVTGYGSVTSGPDVVVTVTEDDTARVTVSPTTLTVFEKGGTVDYTVALTTQPTGDVTITPASGDTSVATVSAALTFTTTDWNTPQTVTVTGMDDGIDNPSDRTATVTHTIAGGDYGSVPVADVAVTAIDANQTLVGFAYNPDEVVLNAPTPPTVTPPSGAQTPLTYSSTTSAVCTVDTNNGALTLVTAGDCNIEVTASETPNFNEETVDFTVMVLPMVTLDTIAGNDIVNFEEHEDGFNISGTVSVGATEVSVTIGSGMARSTTVNSSINWTLRIPPSDPEIASTSVEVVATATTPDGNTGTARRTIGVDLVAPTLVSVTINGDILTLLYDEPLNGSFVPSTTTYTVEVMTPGTPPAVQVHPVNTVSISGMTVTLMLFTAVTANDMVTLDYLPPGADPVRDVGGNDAAMLMLDAETVTNNTSAGLTPRQAMRLHEEILPQVAQAAAVNFTASMGERIDTVIGGAVLPAEGLWLDGQRIDGDKKAVLLGFLEKAPEYRLSIKEDTLNWKRMLGNSSFVLNLAGENGARGGASLWGSGYYTDFDSEVNADSDNEALKWDGGSFGFQIGADTRMTDNLLTGVAVSWVEGDMEYTLGSGDTRNKGDYTMTLTGIHPYVGWSDDDDRWSLWSSAGYAKGKVEIDPDEASRQKYDTSLVSIAGGFKRKLSGLFNIKGDFSIIEIDVDESHDVEDDRGLSIDSQRLRLLLEAKNKRTLADGGLLTHSGEIGYRVDEGDSETDSDGAELGASIDYHNPATNFTLAGKARALVGNGDHQDWGISGFIRLQPDRYGQGISFTLEPGYGNTSGSADDLWDRRPSPLPIERSDYSARMKAHLGYGLYGFVTPYTEISAEDALRRYRMGVRWQPGEFLDLNLFGEQSQGADTENALRLEGELRF